MQYNSKPKIAIDGPAGAGKSSVARKIAVLLELKYLDTGAMYRAITLKVITNKLKLDEPDVLNKTLNETEIKFGEDNKIYLDNKDVTDAIRQPEVNSLVSPVSAIPVVRKHLVSMQQAIAKESGGIIMEGRDIASRVMPDADFKFYLDASIEERAKRRCKEQLEKGIKLTLDEVIKDIESRDRIDSQRKDSPLTVVDDAIFIDTTGLSFEQVVNKVVGTVNNKLQQR
ncbi:MAG: (d)CMP kinase [Bacillota bacterium]